MNVTNVSEKSICTLQELNDEIARKRLPTTIYLSILLVLGIAGNIVVLYVYGPTFRKNNFKTFTVCLAVVDLVACCVYIPMEIVDQVLPLMFYSELACKLGRFIGRVTTIGSPVMLVIIAFERHRKICLPFKKQISNKHATILCVVGLGISVVLALPTIFIEGLKKKEIGDIVGYDCGTSDGIRETIWPFLYTVELLCFYSSFILIIIVLYFLVIKHLTRKSKALNEHAEDRAKTTRPVTKIMFCISIASILSYLPHFGLELNGTIKKGHYGPETDLTLGILPILSRSYFINNIINPFILAVGDKRFRVLDNASLKGTSVLKRRSAIRVTHR